MTQGFSGLDPPLYIRTYDHLMTMEKKGFQPIVL